jgi:putative ABC transport system permease protein
MAEGMPRNFPQYPNPWGLVNAGWYSTTPGYFAALRIDLLKGRPFQDSDTANGPLVMIVDDEFAREAWPDEANPLGRGVAVAITGGTPYEWRTVVGVVRHVRDRRLNQSGLPQAYFPITQMPFNSLFVAMRTAGDPARMAAAVRDEVRSLDPALPVFEMQTMSERFSRAVAPQRFNAGLMGTFGLLAVGLGAVGLFGVIAYTVSQRIHEVGIRMALGAQREKVLLMILGQGLWLILFGLAIGLGGALALNRLMSSVLFGVSTTDVATFVSASLIWLAVAVLACYIPARRAMKVDPVTALRHV